MKRKLLACLLTAAMTLSLLPTAAFAVDADETQQPVAEQTVQEDQDTEAAEEAEPEAETQYVAQVGETQYATLAEAIKMAASGSTIKLLADTAEAIDETYTSGNDVTFGDYLIVNKDLTIDLGNHKWTITNGRTVDAGNGHSLTIQNGEIVANAFPDGITSVFSADTGATLVIDNITMTTTGAALYPSGSASAVTVTNSNITAGTYALGTNANGKQSMNVVVTLKGSTFVATGYQNNDRDTCTVMINVPGKLDIDNCNITGGRQALAVRGGTATVKDSNITLTDVYAGSDAHKYDDAAWGSGNNLPIAALLVGNRVANKDTGAYAYPTDCTVTNTTITAPTGYDAVYGYGMESGANNDRSVKLDLGSDCTLNGNVRMEGLAAANLVQGDKAVYSSIEAALDAGETNVKLLQNLTEKVAIPTDYSADKNIVLDLNGKTLDSVSGYVLDVYCNLTPEKRHRQHEQRYEHRRYLGERDRSADRWGRCDPLH